MKFGAVLSLAAVVCAALGSPRIQAAGADDIYLDAYRLIQEGDQFNATGQAETARQRYLQAQENLKRLRSSYPNYSKGAVDFRLEYIQDKISSLPAPKDETPKVNAAPAANPASKAATPEDQLRALNAEIARLSTENSSLQAKLKEAMAPRPASVDPQEFAKAQERIKELEKEKELLRASADQAKAKQPQALELEQLEQLKAELANTKKQLVESIATVATLTQENQKLQQARAAASAEASKDDDGSKVKSLEKERDALMKKLNDANKELYDVKARGQAAQVDTLTNQLANLRSRLEVFEARKVPYTPEEMALLNKTGPQLATGVGKPRNRQRELPSGAAPLITAAEAAFAAHRYDEAEQKYAEVLKLDEDNPLTLENLAAIQLQLQKYDAADKNLKKALAESPDDAYALSLLGMLRVQQGNYAEALDALSRSAHLDPKNPETENYLGITLSQQGQREAAETALRKAVTLNPKYADAHHNLAVVYATQQPPFIELAKYHYNKALSLGQPPNPDLEKRLEGGSPSGSPGK